jgi:tetratricopeptide (TPR) repeat protein
LARYYMRSQNSSLDDVRREELVRQHLDHATSVDPNNQMAHMSMAALYIEKARREKKDSDPYKANLELAVEQLTRVANGRLTLNQIRAIPQLIELQLELGNEAQAKRHSEYVTARLLPIARKNPEVFDLWLTVVRCSVLIKNHDEALDAVKEALQLSKDKTVKRSILQLASMIYLQKASSFQDMSDRQQYIQRLNGLCEAIRLNPTDKAVFLKLLDYVNSGPSTAPRIEQTSGRTTALDFSSVEEIWLRDAIIGSPVPGVIHALLGMRAISAGKVSEGEKHWRIAEQQFVNTQIVVNNLIDVAAKNRPEEYPNILEMITVAIELFPEQPVFYQTRGVYMKNQGNLEAAVADLNYAMEKMPQMISLHQYLILCYELLGDEQKVTEQRILMEEKLSQLDDNNRKLVEASFARLN